MIIRSRKKHGAKIEIQGAPVQKTAASAPAVRKSEKPQPKVQIETEAEVKPVIKTENQVEEKIKEIKVPKKRSLLEEILEEQATLDD